MNTMKIYTYISSDGAVFRRLKRKKWASWKFLVSGEWSESPMHQGNCYFYVSYTSDKRYWAVLNRGFPKRIVALAEVNDGSILEEIAAKMLAKVREDDGEYISLMHRHGDINVKRFWSLYRERPKEKQETKEPLIEVDTRIPPLDDFQLALRIIDLNPIELGPRSYDIVKRTIERKIKEMGRESAFEYFKQNKGFLKADALYLSSLAD